MNSSKSKTPLFLMEIIISILFFSLASAVCVQVFVKAYELDRKSVQLNRAIAESQCIAEIMLGSDDPFSVIQSSYSDAVITSNEHCMIFYDKQFQKCTPQDSGSTYVADITFDSSSPLQCMNIRIQEQQTALEIYSLEIQKFADY